MIKWKYGRARGITFEQKSMNRNVQWNNYLAYGDGSRNNETL